MRTVGHIITSAGVGCVSYWRYKSKPAAVATFLAGWLIDLDHLVDYVRAHGWKPNWARFKEAEHERYSGKLYLPLHSFELLAAFYLLFRGPNKQAYRVGISLSILTHLILDQKCNPARHPLTYFLSHRIAKKFNADEILKPGYRLASGTN
ncbi:MAG: hypothetical protein KC777_27335 [Cyanobacteria bacterium HKST-UBA02]|nr:hypothetical protein [Candidatus Melainabacteria bacterium]MCA9805727.1 hypothetical protein [Cyanobacteria bacterium HKST-UBA02]